MLIPSSLGTKSETIVFRKAKGKNPLTEKNTIVYLNHFSPLDFFKQRTNLEVKGQHIVQTLFYAII